MGSVLHRMIWRLSPVYYSHDFKMKNKIKIIRCCLIYFHTRFRYISYFVIYYLGIHGCCFIEIYHISLFISMISRWRTTIKLTGYCLILHWLDINCRNGTLLFHMFSFCNKLFFQVNTSNVKSVGSGGMFFCLSLLVALMRFSGFGRLKSSSSICTSIFSSTMLLADL